MSHVEKRGPKRYVAVWQTPDGRRRGKSFARKIDAERHLTVTDSALLRREWVDPDAGRVTFGEYAALWVAVRDVRETTRAKYGKDIKAAGTLATVPLSRLTPAVLEQWQAGMLKRYAKSTTITTRATVAAILNGAVRDKRIPSNPLRELPRIKPDGTRIKLLTRAQVIHVRDNMTPWYQAAVDVGRGCGLRPGEIFGLTRDRVDFEARTIHVDQQLIYTKARGLHIGPPKTAASVRDVPAPRFVTEALAAHILKYGSRGDTALVFTTRPGHPVDGGVRADAWRRVGRAGSRWHDLRHFYASTLIEQGASVKEVQERLGHATAQETLNTYAHLWPGSDDRTRQRIEAAERVEQAGGDTCAEPSQS